MPGMRKPDVVVIGGGAAGMVVAAETTARGLGTVVLEAGAWLHPQRHFTGDEWDMLQPSEGVFRWGPSDRHAPPWPRERDGVAGVFQIAGVGGSSLGSWGASPRAGVGSIDGRWPMRYRDLVPWYERIEEALPVRIPETLAPKDEAFIEGCRRLGLDHLLGPDVDRIGWRFQPMSVSPLVRTDDVAFPAADGCTACGGCIAGCRSPQNAPLERTAMRTSASVFAPAAYATGLLDLRTGCNAIELVHEAGVDGASRVRAVRYRAADGRIIEQDGEVFVLAAGAIESPRLYLMSGLIDGGLVGRGLTTHAMDLVSGELPADIEPARGVVSMARCDFPNYGAMFSMGLTPMLSALAAATGTSRSHGPGPWATRGALVGTGLKRRMERWPRTLAIGISVDDTVEDANEVRLSTAIRDVHGPAPRVHYRASDETVRRRDWLARRAAEMLLGLGAEPDSVHRADLANIIVHAHGTMRMGRDPSSSVTDGDGRCRATTNLYCADASILPSALGGADPALTVQACASMVADAVAHALA